MFRLFVAALFMFSVTAANAGVILMNNAGTSMLGGSGYEGHSFTMPAGGAYNNITWSWISSDQSTLLAAGNLFLLTQEYLGSPNGLSAGTPGYVAESTGIAASAYQFASTVVLNPATQYWVYMGGDSSLAGGGYTFSDPFAGGQAYEQFSSVNGNYFNNGSTLDFNFVLSGDRFLGQISAPGMMAMFGMGVLGLGLMRRRKRA